MKLPRPTEVSTTPRERSGIGPLLLFLAFALLALAVGFLTPLRQFLTVESVRVFARELGPWGPVGLLLFGAFGPLLFLPRWPVCFAGGILYGIVWGSVLGNMASLLGAWIHYATTRALAASGAEILLNQVHIDPAALRKKDAFWLLFLLRAVPVSNSVLTNVLAGALKMSTGAYLAASFLGMLPSTVLYATWGKLMKRPAPGLFALATGVLLAMMLGSVAIRRYVYRKS